MGNLQGSNFFSKVTDTLSIALNDESGLAVLAKCTGTPPVTAGIFQHGCLLFQTDTTTGSAAVWQNVGSLSGPSWKLLDLSAVASADTLAYTTDATAGALTITAAMMVNGILDRDGGGADRSDVTDTATNLVGAIPNAAVGTVFYFYLRNISGTDNQKITITAGAGVTVNGNAVVSKNGARLFIGRITNVAAPAVTLYGMEVAQVVDMDLAAAKIIVGSAAGKAAPVSMSGDATISNTGAVTLSAAQRRRDINARISALPAPTGANQLANERFVFKAPQACTAVQAVITSGTATAGSGANDQYTITLKNKTSGLSLSSASVGTNTSEFAAEVPKQITVDQNLSIAANDVIIVNIDILDSAAGGPTNLSAANITVQFTYSY